MESVAGHWFPSLEVSGVNVPVELHPHQAPDQDRFWTCGTISIGDANKFSNGKLSGCYSKVAAG